MGIAERVLLLLFFFLLKQHIYAFYIEVYARIGSSCTHDRQKKINVKLKRLKPTENEKQKKNKKTNARLTWVMTVEVCVVDHPDHLYGRKHDGAGEEQR